MKDSSFIKFLYNTVPGRILLRLLISPWISKIAAIFLKSPISSFTVHPFIKKNDIDMSVYTTPDNGYRSFNDFFTRKMKPEYITVNDGSLVSPCCALLTVSAINNDLIFKIKNTQYSLKELLKDENLAREYNNGTAYVFRLTPAHYHRYIYCTNGEFILNRFIKGILHSVQPICHEKTKVFVQNSREYTIIYNKQLGQVVQMEIGALLVGKITNHKISAGTNVIHGQEKGFFEYGGSSIVVLVKSSEEMPENIRKRECINGEFPVFIGETLIA